MELTGRGRQGENGGVTEACRDAVQAEGKRLLENERGDPTDTGCRLQKAVTEGRQMFAMLTAIVYILTE